VLVLRTVDFNKNGCGGVGGPGGGRSRKARRGRWNGGDENGEAALWPWLLCSAADGDENGEAAGQSLAQLGSSIWAFKAGQAIPVRPAKPGHAPRPIQ